MWLTVALQASTDRPPVLERKGLPLANVRKNRSVARGRAECTSWRVNTRMRQKLGICQWFHFEDFEGVERAVVELRELGVRQLRTGISWADYHRPGGAMWVDWQMEKLSEFAVLLSIWHTPPSLSEGGVCASPPRRLRDYADFIDLIITRHGEQFETLELWNEPNNRLKWDFLRYDPDWSKFARMIGDAANWAKQRGRKTVLGGMMPVDHHWLETLRSAGALAHIDVVGIHGFPEMWWQDHPNWEWYRDWHGWAEKIRYIGEHAQKPIWITETGFATWDCASGQEAQEYLQLSMLRDAAAAPCERVYWYCLEDLDPAREAIEGFHVDEHEYHMGLLRHRGSKKEAHGSFLELLRGETRLRRISSGSAPRSGSRPRSFAGD